MVRNSLSNWLGLIVTGAINLILTPLLIHELGDFRYGIWILVYSVLSYYGLLDLGMYTASLRFVAKASGEGDRQTLNQIFVTSLGISSAVGMLAILVTAALAWWLPDFLGLAEASRSLFRWVLSLLGLSIAITFPTRLLGNYLCGLRRFDLFNVAKIATSALRAGMMLVALKLGHGVLGLAWATLIAALLSLPLHWFLIRRADPFLAAEKSSATWPRVRELVGFSFFSFLSVIGNYGRFYLDALVIARVLIVELVTPFNVATQLVEYFREIMNGVLSPLIASFSSLVGRKCSQASLQQALLQATKFTSLLSLFVGSLLFLNGRVFIRLWVGERFSQSYDLLVILAVGYVIMLAQVPSNALLYALSKHRAMAAWTLTEGLANVALSVYLARHYGLAGVALGTAIPMVVVAIFVQPWYVLHQLNLPVGVYAWRALTRPAATSVIFLTLSQLAGSQSANGGLLGLALRVLGQTVLFMVLALTIGLNREDRRLCFDRWRQLAILRAVRPNQRPRDPTSRVRLDWER